MKRILVVDDKFKDLEEMKDTLKKGGYEVVGATNGAQALDSLKGNTFDMVLIDIKMPTLSGYDLVRLLREKMNHKVPLLFVSIVPRVEVDLSEIDGFIQKPFDPQEFLDQIKKAFENFKLSK